MKYSLEYELRHTLIVGLSTLVFGLLGLIASSWFFIGRELAQAEYRAIKRYYQGKRANAPEWVAFDKRVWDTHSWWWNLLLPILIGGITLGIRVVVIG